MGTGTSSAATIAWKALSSPARVSDTSSTARGELLATAIGTRCRSSSTISSAPGIGSALRSATSANRSSTSSWIAASLPISPNSSAIIATVAGTLVPMNLAFSAVP